MTVSHPSHAPGRTSRSPLLFLLPALLASLLLLPAGCKKNPVGAKSLPKRVAVYNGTGSWDVSALAAKKALEAAGRTVDFVDESAVQASLSDYGLFVMPGGDPLEMASALGFTGRERIRNLVQTGGGFIGLAGGAYLAGDTLVYRGVGSIESLIGLYHGSATGPINAIAAMPSYVMTNILLDDNRFNPGLLHSIQVVYRGGPEWTIDDPVDVGVAGTFSATQGNAAVFFPSGFGRVVLVSVDPEVRVNSDADGSSWGGDLTDPESDWFWFQSMAEWCLREFN